jgi:DNA polymerase
VIADASQIEARGLAWLAGQWDLLEKFEKGEEIYCGFAEKVLGYPVRKPREGGVPAIEAKMKWARNSVGKVGVLGCGYGMGASKAIGYSGGTLDLTTAEELVRTYRAANPAVVQLWENLEKAFVYAYRYNQEVCLYGLRIAPGASVDSVLDPCDMTITLPSGRILYYQSVRVTDRWGQPSPEIFNPKEKTWVRIWGGYLTENVVQALSRDLLWGAIARLEEQGDHVALHVHDELILVVPTPEAEDALERAIDALSMPPWWAPDIPLAAEGVVSTRYGGH